MAIISIDLLKTKFESGDFPRSRDYVDLIDTLSSITGAGLSADSETTLTNKTISGSDNTLSNIGNASLTNSSITINSNQVSLGGSVSLTTDNISEGTNNKYFSDEKVQDAISTAIVSGTGITKSYDDNANSLTISVDTDTISTKSYVQTEISNLIDSAPNALNTLNELAAALGDDSNFATTITNSLATKAPIDSPTFTGTVSGITKSMVGLSNVDNTSDVNKPISTATQNALDAKASASDLSSHASDTTNIHGIANTADLATQAYVDQAESDAISTAAADATTKANAAQSAAENYADGLAVNYDSAGSASSAQTAAQSYADSAISNHSSDTTNVHGIIDTSDLVLTDDARLSDNRTPSDGSVTDAKVAAGGLSQSSITNLTTDLATKAPLTSPDLTGTPTAPTATAGTNTTQIATTAFVSTAVANIVDSAPATLDTLNELASALADDPNFSTTITNSIAAKAPVNNPTFTGTVTIPAGSSITGVPYLANENTFSNTNIFNGNSIFSGTITETSTVQGIHAGVQNNTPRIMFAPPGSTTSANNWQIDVSSGVFRWFTPGIEQMTLNTSGQISANAFIKKGGIASQFLKADGSVDSSEYITTSSTNTLTNKRITNRVNSISDSASPTPNADSDDMYIITALTQTATFGAPTGTPTQGQKLIIRIKDNGSARTLAWNSIYRASSDLSLPTITVASKTMYLGFIYNSTDSKWDLLSRMNNF